MPKTPLVGKVTIYADGSITTQRAGAGIVLCNQAGQLLVLANQTLPRMTNNEAEYAALHMALYIACRYQLALVEIRMDSEIVVKQMAGEFAVHSATLKLMHLKACAMARRIEEVHYTYIPRDQNALADALATEASAGRLWHTER